MCWPTVTPLLADARPVRWSYLVTLGLITLVLVVTAGGCRGMLPAPRVGIATPAARIAAVPAPARDEVVVYLVTSDEQAGLLRQQVSTDNDSRGRHDLVLVVGASQALIINAAALQGGLPRMRVIDLQRHPDLPDQMGGSGVAVQPVNSP